MAVGSSGYWVNHSNSRFVVEPFSFDRAPERFCSGARKVHSGRFMLIWLLHHFGPLLERIEPRAAGESRVFLTTRTALASVTAFLIALLLGPMAIAWLKTRFRERIASDSARLNEIQAVKTATPTMGGLFILSAVLVA